MKNDLLRRLIQLEAAVAHIQEGKTVFVLEDGSRLLAEHDPLTYLLKNGPQTPRGRIVGYEYVGGPELDPVSRSVDEYITEMIGEQPG